MATSSEFPGVGESSDCEDSAKPLAAVIDIGSDSTRCGFAGMSAPKLSFKTVVGRPKHFGILPSGQFPLVPLVGAEAVAKRGISFLKYPVENGIVTNWNDFEKLTQHVFSQLKVGSAKQSVLMTEAELNPKRNREKLTQIMFETFEVPSLFVAVNSVLSLLANGRTNGLVLESGDGVTHTVAVFQGHALRHATLRMDIAGRDLTVYLRKVLSERGYSFTTSAEMELVRQMKEEMGYVSADFYKAVAGECEERTFQLPDGQCISVGSELFRCAEPMFQPSLVGMSMSGVHRNVYWSVQKCDALFRDTLFSNIVVSGGNTSFLGFEQRVESEVTRLAPSSARVKVSGLPVESRPNSAWIGGAILASMPLFEDIVIGKHLYDEFGPTVVHHKCF